MYCTNCGNQYEGNFCPNCGAENEKDDIFETVTKPKEDPTQKKFSWFSAENRTRTIMIAIALCTCILFAIVIIYSRYHISNNKDRNLTPVETKLSKLDSDLSSAVSAYDNGNRTEAAEILEACLKNDPTYDKIYLTYADLLVKNKKYLLAIEALEVGEKEASSTNEIKAKIEEINQTYSAEIETLKAEKVKEEEKKKQEEAEKKAAKEAEEAVKKAEKEAKEKEALKPLTDTNNEPFYTKSGKGDNIISGFNAKKDTAISITNDTKGHFAVKAHKNDKYYDLLVNTTGVYSGTVFLPSGQYDIEIKSGGNWSISAKEIETTSKISFSGKGDFVTSVFKCTSNKYKITNDGNGHFAVKAYYGNGKYNLLANTTDPYSGTVMFQNVGNSAFFVIKSDGNWSIEPVE